MAENEVDNLIVSIDLDSENFSLSCKRVGEDLRHAADEARETAEKMKEQGEKAGEFFEKLKEHAIEFFGIMASTGAFLAFTESTIKSQTAVNHLSEETKMSVEDISLWQNAAVIAGGSAEGFNQSLKGMGESLIAIEKGLPRAQRAMKAFEAAGIHGLGKGKHVEITDMYQKIHDKFQGLSMVEAQTLGKRMQLDEATIRVLHKSGEEYDEFMAKAKAAGQITKEQAEAAEQTEEALNGLKISMQHAAEVVVQLMLPGIKWLSEALTKVAQWAQQNPEVIKAVLLGIAAAALVMGQNAIIAGAKMFAGWVMATGGLILIPALIGAVIAGLALLYMKSETFRELIAGGWNYIRTIMIALWDTVKDVFGAIESGLDLLVGIFTMDGSRISAAWGSVCGFINAAFKKLGAILVFYVLTMAVAVVNTFNLMWGVIKKPAETFFNWIAEKFAAVAKVFKAIASLIPGASAGSQVGSTGGQAPMHDTSPGNFLPRAVGAAVAAGGLAFSPAPKTHIPSPAPSGLVQAPTTTAKPTFDENAFNKAWEEHQQQRLNGYHAGDAIRPSSVNSSNSASTSSMHVDTINVNAPQATDAQGVAGGITGALAEKHSDLVNQADGGMS
jgi:hypothetical protein